MIKAIIFDYGGVLSTIGHLSPVAKKFSYRFKKDSKEFDKLIHYNWKLARVNKISSDMFWKNTSKYLGMDKEKFRKEFISYYKFRKNAFRLIKKLKKNYKLGLLSNNIKDWLGEIIKHHKLNEIFYVIDTSYKFKIAKPDIRIFKDEIKKLKVKPNECIYIDDLEKNIPPARKLGMKTILFKDVKQLKKELKSYGVKS